MTIHQLYWVILAIALLTWIIRASPFLLLKHQKINRWLSSARFNVLGPAILASTTTLVLFSDLQKTHGNHDILSYLCALFTVILVLKWTKHLGLSVLSGMLVYGLFYL